MNIKDINKYKFIVLDKKITNIYWKFLCKKNISVKKKLYLRNSFFAFLIYLEWCLVGRKYNNLKKISSNENILNLSGIGEKFIANKDFKFKLKKIFMYIAINILKKIPFSIKTIHGPGTLEVNFFKRQINKIKYNIFYKKISEIKLINVKSNRSIFLSYCKKEKIKNFEIVNNIVPDSYFSDPIDNKIGHNLTIYGASDLIYDSNISKILTLKKKIKFINLVHGGGYYEFKNSMLENQEKYLAGNYPQVDTKSLKNNSKYKSFNNIKIIYALRSVPREEDSFANPDLYKHLFEKKNFETIKPFIKKYKMRIRHHPRGINPVYKSLKLNKNTSNKINKNNLIIFDTIGSSLAFWLISNNIPFVYIINKLDLKTLHKRTVKYVKASIMNKCFLLNKNNKEIDLFIREIITNKVNLGNIIKTNKKLFKELKYKIN